jgi:hypothetical protein
MVAGVRRTRLLPLLLVAALVAGCGGSTAATSTGSATTATSATATTGTDRATYIARADALCKTANTRQEALRARAKGLAVTKLPPVLRQQASIAQTLATALGKLAPPTGDRATVGRFVRSVHELSVYSMAVANSIAANHAFAARALANKLGVARQQETLLGQGYGYKVCASGKSY